MSRLNSNKARQDRAVRDRRGRGEGDGYVPHIQLGRHEFASRGRSAYTPSLILDRHHVEISHLETKINLYLPLLRPADVREGYRLELQGVEEEFAQSHPYARGTVEIAASLGWKYPIVDGGDHFVMSTDFVVTAADFSKFAVSGKWTADLANARVQELMRIEELYWHDRGCDHYVATEEDFDRKVVNNLELMASFRISNVVSKPDAWFIALAHAARTAPIREALRAVSGESENILVDTLKHAVATGRVTLDLSRQNLRWDSVWPPMSIDAPRRPPFTRANKAVSR